MLTAVPAGVKTATGEREHLFSPQSQIFVYCNSGALQPRKKDGSEYRLEFKVYCSGAFPCIAGTLAPIAVAFVQLLLYRYSF